MPPKKNRGGGGGGRHGGGGGRGGHPLPPEEAQYNDMFAQMMMEEMMAQGMGGGGPGGMAGFGMDDDDEMGGMDPMMMMEMMAQMGMMPPGMGGPPRGRGGGRHRGGGGGGARARGASGAGAGAGAPGGSRAPPPKQAPYNTSSYVDEVDESDSGDSEDEEAGADMFSRMMGGMIPGGDNPNYSREFLAKLEPDVRERVAVLEAAEKANEGLEEEHERQIKALRRKYAQLAKPIFEKRRLIVAGEAEPADEQVLAGFPDSHKDKVSITDESTASAKVKAASAPKPKPKGKDSKKKAGEPAPASTEAIVGGVEDFWLKALQRHTMVEEIIEDHDEEALKFCTDISYDLLEEPDHGFTMTFTFAPNPFFTNATLSKTFYLRKPDVPDMKSVKFVPDRFVGTTINWNEGKDLSVKVKTVKKKNKKGQSKVTSTTEQVPTFFDFFRPELSEVADGVYYGIALVLKQKVIPYAVEYFTGEASDGESDMAMSGIPGGGLGDDDDDEMMFGGGRGGGNPMEAAMMEAMMGGGGGCPAQ